MEGLSWWCDTTREQLAADILIRFVLNRAPARAGNHLGKGLEAQRVSRNLGRVKAYAGRGIGLWPKEAA